MPSQQLQRLCTCWSRGGNHPSHKVTSPPRYTFHRKATNCCRACYSAGLQQLQKSSNPTGHVDQTMQWQQEAAPSSVGSCRIRQQTAGTVAYAHAEVPDKYLTIPVGWTRDMLVAQAYFAKVEEDPTTRLQHFNALVGTMLADLQRPACDNSTL